jgi:hypothetical protein
MKNVARGAALDIDRGRLDGGMVISCNLNAEFLSSFIS